MKGSGLVTTRPRLVAILLALGAGLLLYRTVAMVSGGALDVLIAPVAGLLLLELGLDILTIGSAVAWAVGPSPSRRRLTIALAVVITLLHVLRVVIFVMGRSEPFLDFDVRPDQRADHGGRWTWGGVYLASLLSILAMGVLGWAAVSRFLNTR